MTVQELRSSIKSDSLQQLNSLFVMLANNYGALKPEAQGDCRERMCAISNELFARSVTAATMQERQKASKLYNAAAAEILGLS